MNMKREKKQKFYVGDLVALKTKEYGYGKGTLAIIEDSSNCGSWSYSLHIVKDGNICAWTDEEHLKLKGRGPLRLIKK
jgi:hypothetical protein